METIETWCTDKMVCPYCGCVVDDTDYHIGESDDTGTCEECGRDFGLEIEYSPTFYTRKLDEGI